MKLFKNFGFDSEQIVKFIVQHSSSSGLKGDDITVKSKSSHLWDPINLKEEKAKDEAHIIDIGEKKE